MQVTRLAALGDVDVLNFGDVATPSRKAGHVLIKIAAVGHVENLGRPEVTKESSHGVA
jgi:hypothetical protein